MARNLMRKLGLGAVLLLASCARPTVDVRYENNGGTEASYTARTTVIYGNIPAEDVSKITVRRRDSNDANCQAWDPSLTVLVNPADYAVDIQANTVTTTQPLQAVQAGKVEAVAADVEDSALKVEAAPAPVVAPAETPAE